MSSLIKVEFESRFIPCDRGCNKFWFLLGGSLRTPGLEKLEIDGLETLAKKVRCRWKNLLLKERPLEQYGEILVQQLGELKVREIWPQFYYPWQHKKAAKANRKRSTTFQCRNFYRTGSIRSFAKKSII